MAPGCLSVPSTDSDISRWLVIGRVDVLRMRLGSRHGRPQSARVSTR